MKTASIETVRAVVPHPNADRLDLLTILGWQCVAKRGEFQPGQTVVFVPPDTILPRAPWSEFLADSKNPDKPIRLKTIKLRGQFSQGLVLPLSVLPENVQGWGEGSDVGGALGVKKYEKEIPAQLSGLARGRFPEHRAPRTDEDNYQSVPDQLAAILASPRGIITQKFDGSSATIVIEAGQIAHVCSRNLDLTETDENAFWKAARGIRSKIPAGMTCVIQAELMGPGIQGNSLGLREPKLFVFQIRASNGQWVQRYLMERCAEVLGLDCVPRVGGWSAPNALSAEWLQEYADTLTGAPELNPPRPYMPEGIVVRPEPPVTMGNGRPLSVKFINRNYKDA